MIHRCTSPSGLVLSFFFGRVGPTTASVGLPLKRLERETTLVVWHEREDTLSRLCILRISSGRGDYDLTSSKFGGLGVFLPSKPWVIRIRRFLGVSFSLSILIVYVVVLNKQILLSVSLSCYSSSRNQPFRRPRHYLHRYQGQRLRSFC